MREPEFSVGDLALMSALSLARRQASDYRLLQMRHGDPSVLYTRGAYFAFGIATGLAIAAGTHLPGSRDRAMAVANEIRFLSGRYLDPRR